jgi:hypothetical protein
LQDPKDDENHGEHAGDAGTNRRPWSLMPPTWTASTRPIIAVHHRQKC